MVDNAPQDQNFKKKDLSNDNVNISKKDLEKLVKEAVVKEIIKKGKNDSISFFKGRMSRSSYIPRVILITIFNFIAYGAFKTAETQAVAIVFIIFMIIFSIYEVSIVSKRFHDRGKSGWCCFLLLIPFVNIWFVIELLFFRGTVGKNKFEEDPLKLKK